MPNENDDLVIRIATDEDARGIWEIFHAVVAGGDSYAFDVDTPFEEFQRLWMQLPARPYVAASGGRIAGSYFIKPVQPGLGSHVANAGYMTHPEARGRGIGSAMGRHSLTEARRLGYRAMQFNFVVGTNTTAILLWQKLGFTIIGTVPGAFRHARLGFVDTHVMFQTLTPYR